MYTVKEVEKKTHLSINTLRYYDNIGLVSPQRGANGYRYYSDFDILKLQYVIAMQYSEFSLKEIEVVLGLLDEQPSEKCKANSIGILKEKFKHIQMVIENYQKILKVLEQGIETCEKIESFPEEHLKMDSYVREISYYVQNTKNKKEGFPPHEKFKKEKSF